MGFEFDSLGWTTLLVCVGGTFLGNYAGATAIASEPAMRWYRWLRKPAFAPPRQSMALVFGVAWFLISIAGGLSVYLTITQNMPDSAFYQLGISAYWATVFVGIVWTAVFFGARAIGAALAVLLIDLLLAVFTTVAFFFVYNVSGFLLLALDVWLFYALMLNVWIFNLNRGRKLVPAAAPSRKV